MSKISKVIVGDENGLKPILVNFQNGNILEDERTNFQSFVHKDKRNNTVVSVRNKKMLYKGMVDGSEDLYNTFIAVHNTRTNKVRLIQVDLATLSPQLKKDSNFLDSTTVSNPTSAATLKKQFGSKRSKRQTEQNERLQLNIDNVKEDLERTVADVHVEDVPTVERDIHSYQPPINRDGSTPEEVYELDNLVQKDVLKSLREEAVSVLDDEADLNDFNLFRCTQENIRELKKFQLSEKKSVRRCTILLYVDYLMKYMVTPAKSLTKKFVICKSSTLVNNHILNNFSISTNHGRCRPISMRDKSLSYILVLSLIALNYQLNIELLSLDIKMGLKKILDVSRVLGLSQKDKSKTTIVLRLPLAVPISVKKRSRSA